MTWRHVAISASLKAFVKAEASSSEMFRKIDDIDASKKHTESFEEVPLKDGSRRGDLAVRVGRAPNQKQERP